ncbi:MAG TPA: ABC transporter substrate-binding protein [Planosporangium sp.]|nr:ABC transporter substrate-binding protein [Planosporangium sp.]
MRRPLSLLTATMAAVLAAAGCGGGQVRPGPNGASAGAAGTFVYAANLDVVTDWDPATSYSNEIIAMENIYESLTRYNPATKKVEPRLATSWTSGDAGKTWTFTLRPNVKFHTGRAMDATAAKEAIDRTITLKGGPAYIWDSVADIAAPSPTTLLFHLKYATPLDLIASAAYAAYVYDTKAEPAGKDLKAWFGAGHDAGTGPYTVDSWHKGQETEVRLKAFPDYWGGWQGRHYKNVEYRVTPQLTTAWQLLQRGDVSFVQRLNPQIFAQAKKTQGVKTVSTPSFQNLLALFNTANGPMTDVRVRKAVQAAIDVNGLISALKGADEPPTGLVPAGLLGHATDLKPSQDLSKARALLAEAGYGPGKPLTLKMTYAQGDDDQKLFATLLGSALDGLGVQLQATPLQWNAQWDQGKSSDAAKRQDIFVMYWYPDYADPFSWFTNIFHSAEPPYFNLTYLGDKQVDAAIEGLPELTANDRPRAESAYLDLQRRLIADLAVVAPVYVQNYQRAYSATVQGYGDNPAYPNVVFAYDVTPAG